MSELDDFMADGLAEFSAVVGTTAFKIGGQCFTGVLNEFSGARDLSGDGPMVGTYPATLLCPLAQFAGKFAAPLERTMANLRLAIGDRGFRIAQVALDATSLTLTLENADAVK